MRSSSPLGKYGERVAAGLAIAIVGTYLVALLFGHVLQVESDSLSALDKLAFLAVGAVFGAAAAVNGVKGPLTSAHERIDKLETGTGIQTHGAYPAEPPHVD